MFFIYMKTCFLYVFVTRPLKCVPTRDEAVELQRFIHVTSFASADISSLSHFLLFPPTPPTQNPTPQPSPAPQAFSSRISWFALHVINRKILFVRLVIHPYNPLKVSWSIDLNVIPNISQPSWDSSRREVLAKSLIWWRRPLKLF